MYGILAKIGGFSSMVPLHPTQQEKDTAWISIIVICAFIAVGFSWALFVILRYYSVKKIIRKKMEWSHNHDSFWNYDNLIYLSQDAYTKAQLFLNTTKTSSLPFLSAHAKARLRQIKKKINSEHDLRFLNSYIVSFSDKKDNSYDELKVYFEIKNKQSKHHYRELVVLKRNGESLIITDVIKNPTMFVISHARSLIEK